MQQALVDWYNASLGNFLPKELFIFFVSMLPLIELRGGVLIGSLLGVPLIKGNIICIIGNIIPIPFILLLIKKIFAFMKEHNILKGLVLKLEDRASKKIRRCGKMENLPFFLLL